MRCKLLCDAGPVIHLHELDALDLLSSFQPLLIPHAVSEEIIQHRTIAFADFGLTLQNPSCLFLTDDAAARLAAQQFRVEVHGTIGILLRAVRTR